jgi:hypothetical protein
MNGLPLNELIDLLASPDPHLRDEVAYSQLAIRIASGTEDRHLREIGDRLILQLNDEAIQTRTFSALVVGCIIERSTHSGQLNRETLLRWLKSFSHWYRAEADLRGWDEELGWLHAVAHGADLIATFAQAPELREEDLVTLLALVAARLLTPTTWVFKEQEEERLGRAAAIVLLRSELTRSSATAWLEPVALAFSNGEPGPTPPWASNTMRTLRVIYIIVNRGFQVGDALELRQMPLREDIESAIAGVLQLASPYTTQL